MSVKEGHPTKRILGLAVHPSTAAATRFRLDALSPYLAERGYSLDSHYLLDEDTFSSLYSDTNVLKKATGLLRGTIRQLLRPLTVNDYHAVIVQREALLFGPPIVEWLWSAVRRAPLIFDYDDAIWLPAKSDRLQSVLAAPLKFPEKAFVNMRRASLLVAGSEHLARKGREYNENVLTAPTVVSHRAWRPSSTRSCAEKAVQSEPIIGWVGTHSTSVHLDMVEEVLKSLRDEGHKFRVRIVGAGARFRLRYTKAEYVDWSSKGEIEHFHGIDIGVAPLIDTPYVHGKCGFKSIQYMAARVPHIATPLGGAAEFLKHGENALLATATSEWYTLLKKVLTEPDLRERLAQGGLATVEERLCIEKLGPMIADAVVTSTIMKASRTK